MSAYFHDSIKPCSSKVVVPIYSLPSSVLKNSIDLKNFGNIDIIFCQSNGTKYKHVLGFITLLSLLKGFEHLTYLMTIRVSSYF